MLSVCYSKNSNLDDSGISLPAFPSRTNLKLANVDVTPNLVKKVIANFDSYKASHLDFFSSGVFEKLWSWTSIHTGWTRQYLCLRKLCFSYCLNVLPVVLVYEDFAERSTPKNYRPVGCLSVASKFFEKHVNNRLLYHLTKCGLFSDFQCGFQVFDS